MYPECRPAYRPDCRNADRHAEPGAPFLGRQRAGRVSHAAGAAAEGSVAAEYDRRGSAVIEERWRGAGGEIDLIARDGAGLVFVEVKRSRDHARALARISRTQMQRIMVAAQEFLATWPGGPFTDIRFDVATVDDRGEVRVLENAFAGC